MLASSTCQAMAIVHMTSLKCHALEIVPKISLVCHANVQLSFVGFVFGCFHIYFICHTINFPIGYTLVFYSMSYKIPRFFCPSSGLVCVQLYV